MWGKAEQPNRYEIARIEEHVVASGGGAFGAFLLVVHNLILTFWFFAGANSAIQEASIGTIWIAGNILWCTAVIVGRKRTYIVTREVQPPDPTVN